MKWVTRKNANVDRIACPWLIRRFVDRDAEFIYVSADEVAAVAERRGAVPFDVKGVELGHVDGRCSFESIMVKYGLTDPALERLARIVHGADVAADVDIVPEAAGLKAIAHGFALLHGDNDHEKIRLETPLYDALYAWCRRQVAEGR
ncbi:MAG: chromate resistance protein [Bacillati bacterium ANGP1]|uniref:Chromate resistance protein n=1 Tax=Candidatus Segetimicrobium genomatis TaxID=2569760 RepID=A0A537J9M7_9BACT|nr:MAG: chromate resistance protein [Terrabacteria group bacterium ANGP1]